MHLYYGLTLLVLKTDEEDYWEERKDFQDKQCQDEEAVSLTRCTNRFTSLSIWHHTHKIICIDQKLADSFKITQNSIISNMFQRPTAWLRWSQLKMYQMQILSHSQYNIILTKINSELVKEHVDYEVSYKDNTT